ncbi:MAG: putative zinc-binding peptidase [Trueperaceae bacterium]|nr:putative zinc-binding peptidase [Trueperaceae bacterium]
MKSFTCGNCHELVFFENTHCLTCQSVLAYSPANNKMLALEPLDENIWKDKLTGESYKLCYNYQTHNVCNWALTLEDPHALCPSCQLTEVIPNLAEPANREVWVKLETAKRRLIYSLISLGLPVASKEVSEAGLSFKFLEDSSDGKAVLTGHADGVITLNLAEADNTERERRRQELGEPYRTLLGHFRHESGHYYWDRLIRDSDKLGMFRELFGDEREDYAASLSRYYEQGAPNNWQDQFVSAYASSHPWEDWAETWAHYLHMIDTLETAESSGLRFAQADIRQESAFDTLAKNWFQLTYLLNNLNRSLGLVDAYPFVLSQSVLAKLKFIDELVR